MEMEIGNGNDARDNQLFGIRSAGSWSFLCVYRQLAIMASDAEVIDLTLDSDSSSDISREPGKIDMTGTDGQ